MIRNPSIQRLRCPRCDVDVSVRFLLNPMNQEYIAEGCKHCGFDWSNEAYARREWADRMKKFDVVY